MCTQMLYRTFVSNVVTKYCNKCCTYRCTYCICCTYNVVHVSERIIVPAGHDVQCDMNEVHSVLCITLQPERLIPGLNKVYFPIAAIYLDNSTISETTNVYTITPRYT